MKITYQNTYEDMEKMNWYFFKNTRDGKRIVNRSLAVRFLIAALLCIIGAIIIDWRFFLSFFVLGVLLAWFARNWVCVKGAMKTIKKQQYKWWLTSVTVSIEDEGIRTEIETGSGFYKWEIVDHAVNKNDCIFVMLKAYGGFAIPKRAFENQEAFDVFYKALFEKIGQNVSGI